MKKHILCLGDSNTHGYCADPADCADGGIRFNEDERWTKLNRYTYREKTTWSLKKDSAAEPPAFPTRFLKGSVRWSTSIPV